MSGLGLVALVFVLALPILGGCGVDIGPVQEIIIDERLGGAAVSDVELSMGAGTLTIGPGAAGLASGTVRYNVEPWKPEIVRDDDSLAVRQGDQKGLAGLGSEIINEWSIRLGASPVRLKVTAGAYRGTYDLGGLTLLGLTIKDGAAQTQVDFSSPNLGQIDLFKYETGASKVSMTGLAYANFKSMEFSGGAGSYLLDFSGELRTDALVKVKAGVGSVELRVPIDTATRITVDGSLNDISLEGSWTTVGKTHSNPAADAGGAGRVLNISVDMSVGTLRLVSE